MKRLWICAALLVLLLTACAGNTVPGSDNTGNSGDTSAEPEVLNLTSAAEDFYLAISDPAPGDDVLNFTIVNATGADAEILLIPTLELKGEDGQWAVIPTDKNVGFCGTPDPLPNGEKEWSVELEMLWNNLYAGEYRLSFTVTDASGQEHTAAGEFALAYDIAQIER